MGEGALTKEASFIHEIAFNDNLSSNPTNNQVNELSTILCCAFFCQHNFVNNKIVNKS